MHGLVGDDEQEEGLGASVQKANTNATVWGRG
jgi:hypothetical protein